MSGRKKQPVVSHRYFWCSECGVPIISENCGMCGGNPKNGRVKKLINPGFDTRPALNGTKILLKRLFRENFGSDSILEGIVLLTKTGGRDRDEEIIIDGRRAAHLFYDIEKREYRLELRGAGASMLINHSGNKENHLLEKRTVRIRKGFRGHIKGKVVPYEFIEFGGEEPDEGDSVIVLHGSKTGSGIYLGKRGVKVRDILSEEIRWSGTIATLKDAVRANRNVLKHLEKRGRKEIEKFMDNLSTNDRRKPLLLSFSGGKDSLAAMMLLYGYLPFEAVYIDTGIEFPETVEYVKKLCKELHVKLHIASAGDSFFDAIQNFGPPAKDYRWCCKVCKLAPVTKLIEDRWKNGVISIEGRRQSESFSRSGIEFAQINPFLKKQIQLNPIREWGALEVWLYILWKDIPYNPLYDNDMERVGCWLCPSSLQSEFDELKKTHPELHEKWTSVLEQWFDKEQIESGLWRWKEPPPKMHGIMEKRGISEPEAPMKLVKEESLYFLRGLGRERSEKEMAASLNMLGPTNYNGEHYELEMHGEEWVIKPPHGSERDWEIHPLHEKNRDKKDLELISKQIMRVERCANCGVCAASCPTGAIKLDGIPSIDTEKCIRCGQCFDSCVIHHYFNRMVVRRIPEGYRKRNEHKGRES